MKRILSLSLVLCMIVLSLTGCNSKLTFSSDYDTSKFSSNGTIPGIIFLEPLKYSNEKIAYDKMQSEIAKLKTQEEKSDYFKNHVAFIAVNKDYQLMKLSEFYMYVMTLSGIADVTSYQKVEELPSVFGVDKFIDLKSANPSLRESVDGNDGTRIIFGSDITVTDDLGESQYHGYTVLLQNKSDKSVYALIVGYGDSSKKSTAKTIAENFYLN